MAGKPAPDHETRHADIRAAALRLITEAGFEAAAPGSIAAAIGRPLHRVLYHCGSREKILDECANLHMDALLTSAAPEIAAGRRDRALKRHASPVISMTTDDRGTLMSVVTEHEAPVTAALELQRVANLLGGAQVLRHTLSNPLDAHEMLLRGLPSEALRHLVDTVASLRKPASLEKALGMSLRTFQRRKDAPAKPLNPEQSGRTWKFAEILAKATTVFGSQDEAEQWLERPAIGLDQRRPIDLLATPAGVEAVETYLKRIEYGVYT